ncbi:MAG: hypothetical protein AB2A00_26375 [Myxococcota bacterium]
MTTLSELLDSSTSTFEQVRTLLDGLDHAGRMSALSATNRAQQRRLYQLAERKVSLTLEDLVPSSRGAVTEVKHHGRNTLPLPRAFRFFQKPMCRPKDGSARLFGFNEGASRPIVGPGYFVAYRCTDKPEWAARGDVVVDYFQVPDVEVVPGWPTVVPNSKGLQMFVFKGTRDFLRGVSQHVTIGTAYKGEKALDHYFTLCRED